LSYLKKPEKKKKKKEKTPIPKGEKRCAGCGSSYNLEIHHVYGGPNRKISSKYGFVEWLCSCCHREKNGVHGENKVLDIELKQKHQLDWEQALIETEMLTADDSRRCFIKLIGKNYLED